MDEKTYRELKDAATRAAEASKPGAWPFGRRRFESFATPEAVLDLIAEVERLSGIVEKYVDPKQVKLTGMTPALGGLTFGLEGGPIHLFAASFAEYFRESPASNYIEMHLASTDPVIGELTCTLQRKQGKTPHELRREAERERDEAIAKLEFERRAARPHEPVGDGTGNCALCGSGDEAAPIHQPTGDKNV